MKSPVLIGTRGSDLALWQANHVKSLLEPFGVNCELKIIKTTGDNIQQLSFDKMEGKGFFTKEIEEELIKGTIDLAVHSHKDLETQQPAGIHIAAVSSRADPSELMLILPSAVDYDRRWSLKKGAVVGTSSARRKSQLLHHRPDIQIQDLRGNVPTRIDKLVRGNYDAILIAKAGVDRLHINTGNLHAEVLDPSEFVPAPAQGVLAIQCRENDHDVTNLLRKIDDSDTRVLIDIERGVLRNMHGGCQLPLGVFAKKSGDEFEVHVTVAEKWNSPLHSFVFISDDPYSLVEIISDRIMTVSHD